MNADIHTLVGAYALDAIDDLERARFDRHLAECESCEQEVAELRATAGRLADVTDLAPPARLKDAVMAQVARTRQVGAGRPATGRGSEVRWRRFTAAAVAAGIIAVGAGAATFAVENQRVRDARSQAAQAQQVADILEAPDAVVRTQDVAGGRVTVVVSNAMDKGVALVHALPDPGNGKTYQLWLIKGDRPQNVGVLAAGTGDGVRVFRDVHGAGQFGVSREAGPAVATTPTQPLVTGFGI
jgi:anti-sigma-K factor RskA